MFVQIFQGRVSDAAGMRAALDRWAGDATAANTLRGLLTDLAQLESSATDAQYELGCDSLRAALSHTDLTQVTEGIVQARRHFGTWDSGDERSADNDLIDRDLASEYGNSR